MTKYFEEEILRLIEIELENYTTDEERNNALMMACEMANQVPAHLDWQSIYERLYAKYNEAGERIYWSKIMKSDPVRDQIFRSAISGKGPDIVQEFYTDLDKILGTYKK